MDIVALLLSIIVALWNVLRERTMGYLKAKGENQATKEDIGEITGKVKSVEIQFETLRDVQIHQYQQQYGIIQDVWRKATSARNKVLSLRPSMSDSGRPPDYSSPEGQKAFREYADIFNAFSESLDSSGPFLPDSVYSPLCKMRTAIYGEGSDYRGFQPDHWPTYWQDASKNQENIRELYDSALLELRNHLRVKS